MSPQNALCVSIATLILCAARPALGQELVLPEPKLIKTPPTAPYLSRIAVSSNNKTIAWISHKTIRLFDLETGEGELLHTLRDNSFLQVAFHPDGKRLAALESHGSAHFWDITTKKPLKSLRASPTPNSMAFSADGKHFVIGLNKKIEMFDLESSKNIGDLDIFFSNVNVLAFAPDGRLAILGFDKGQLWDVAAKKRLTFLDNAYTRNGGFAMSFRSDGKLLVGGGDAGNIDFWDLERAEPFAGLRLSDRILSMAFAPNSNLLACGLDRGGIDLVDAGTQKVLTRLKLAERVYSLEFTADGKSLVASSNDGIRVWDVSKVRVPLTEIVRKDPGKKPKVETTRGYVQSVHTDPKAAGPFTRVPQQLTFQPLEDAGVGRAFKLQYILPSEREIRLVIDDKDAAVKDFHAGDLVEMSFSAARFPATQIRLIEHSPARSKRFAAFSEAMKMVPRLGVGPKVEPEERTKHERKAADAILPLVKENAGDFASYYFLTSLMALSAKDVQEEASALFVEHHIKDPRFTLYVSERATGPAAGLLERLLEQKDMPAYRGRACYGIAVNAYRNAKVSGDKELTAIAEKYFKRLQEEFGKEDIFEAFGARITNRRGGELALEPLEEMKTFWVGRPAPDIAGVDAAGKKALLSDHKGKVVFIIFLDASFASYPKGYFKTQDALMTQHKDKPFTCLAVAPPAKSEALQQFLKKHELNWPVLSMETKEAHAALLKQWSTPERPPSFLVDGAGVLRARQFFSPKAVSAAVEAALKASEK